MDIPFLIGQSLGTALVLGTFLFYLIKGFINPKAKWSFVICGTFIVFIPLYYTSYPQSPLENPSLESPLMNLLNGLLFFGGVAGAIRYYWKCKKNSVSKEGISS